MDQENILNQTGFLGRCSWQFRLTPLALPFCNLFWRGKEISASEKLKVLSVTGGVPRYLEESTRAECGTEHQETLFSSRGIALP